MLHIIASFKSTLWCFPSYLYLCHYSQNYVRPEDVTLLSWTSGQDMRRGHQNCILDPRSPPNCVVGLGIVVQ